MGHYPKKAEAEELEAFFLLLAKKHNTDLRLRDFDGRTSVLKHLFEGDIERRSSYGILDVDIGWDKVRLTGDLAARTMHETLKRMRVPHEYIQTGDFDHEITMTIARARKHLDEALLAGRYRFPDDTPERESLPGVAGRKRGGGSAHSRS
jgi:hypothetical protein